LHQLCQAQLIQHLDIINDDINDLTLAVLQRLQFLVDAVFDDEMNDENFEELIDAKDATEDLLFHVAVSSQIDAENVQDHDEIEFNVVAFEKDNHDFHDQVVAKCDDDVIASFLTHFVVIIDKDSVTLLKETTQHFHAVLQLTCSQVRELMT